MEALLHLRFPGAVEFIRVVLTVVVTVTSPRGLHAKAVVALELIGSAVHVESCHGNRSHRALYINQGVKCTMSLEGNPELMSRNNLPMEMNLSLNVDSVPACPILTIFLQSAQNPPLPRWLQHS
jgi:hypothetical protein